MQWEIDKSFITLVILAAIATKIDRLLCLVRKLKPLEQTNTFTIILMISILSPGSPARTLKIHGTLHLLTIHH